MEDTNTLYDIDFADVEIDEDYVDAMDMLAEENSSLTDEDYLAGWGMTRAEVLGFENFDACYSTFDADDYEYLQGGY